MERDKTPGLTIGFIKDNQTWVKGFGYADLEKKVLTTADSAYRLASVTKTMTGTAIMQLVERGKMKLDEEIRTYVPYYPKQKWRVTVKHLLVHLGGGQSVPPIHDQVLHNWVLFKRLSDENLTRAVGETNGALQNGPRVFLANPNIEDRHAAHAPDPWIFGLKNDFSSEDPVAAQREVDCRASGRGAPNPAWQTCARTSVGHPNEKGAREYMRVIAQFLEET